MRDVHRRHDRAAAAAPLLGPCQTMALASCFFTSCVPNAPPTLPVPMMPITMLLRAGTYGCRRRNAQRAPGTKGYSIQFSCMGMTL